MVRNGWYDEDCKEVPEEQNKARQKCYKGKREVILKPTKRHVGQQGKYVERIMKRKNWKNYKRNVKEIY